MVRILSVNLLAPPAAITLASTCDDRCRVKRDSSVPLDSGVAADCTGPESSGDAVAGRLEDSEADEPAEGRWVRADSWSVDASPAALSSSGLPGAEDTACIAKQEDAISTTKSRRIRKNRVRYTPLSICH